ncbi:MAG TPA: ArsC family (seleno)protein [Gemmatales bacterium]|nr:ArsC family (seleno)protein [Gemmatales bacterium]
MTASIDWLYRRNNCDSCEKADAWLAQHHVRSKSTTDARKERQGKAEALALAKKVDVIITVRGKSLTRLDVKKDKPNQKTLLAALLGPTGNLRAPTFRKGKTLFVGFNPEGYGDFLK